MVGFGSPDRFEIEVRKLTRALKKRCALTRTSPGKSTMYAAFTTTDSLVMGSCDGSEDDWGSISDAEILSLKSAHLAPASSSEENRMYSGGGQRSNMQQITSQDITHIVKASFNKLKREHIPVLSVSNKTPMQRFFRKHLQVTHLCDQSWCEIKMVYGFIKPKERKLEMQRAVVTAGASIHIARELEDQRDVITVPVFTREDREARKLLNMLQKIQDLEAGKRVREFPVFGKLEGIFLSGIVDELCLNEPGELVMSELKTRFQRSTPRPGQAKGHALQVGVYRLLLESMLAGELSREEYTQPFGLQSHKALSAQLQEVAGARAIPSSTFGQLLDHLLGRLTSCSLPRVGAKVRVEYCHQGSGDIIGVTEVAFEEATLRSEVKGHLAYWKGEREPRGVDMEDSWKCSMCPYEDACEWGKDQGETAVTANNNKRAKLVDLQ